MNLKEVKTKPNPIRGGAFDRAIAAVSPGWAAKRMRSRAVMAIASSYHGASRKRKSMSEWGPSSGDADSDINPDLPDLRDRSRDLVRNNPLATGAVHTKVTNIVGTGLVLQARLDRTVLNMTEEQAGVWEKKTEAEWRLFSESFDIDVTRTLNFAGLQALTLRTVLENGDTFILTPVNKNLPGPYKLQLQMIEADRCCNKDNKSDEKHLSGGVEKNKNGSPKSYHFLKGHPGNLYSNHNKWEVVPAFGQKTGRRNVLHIFRKIRIGQSRGVPDLAPVIELLKQLGRYTEAEAAATVISSFFTVFVKTETAGGFGPMQPTADVGGKTSDKDFKMASGAILDLAPNESIETANPGRPNVAFDGFVLAMTRQIGIALELPYEMLIKHFQSSYSAARAALLEAWRFFMDRRKWLADNLCQPIYELWLEEAIAIGRIAAPGFLNGDPLLRKAYTGAEWIGPSKGQIDEKKAVDAAKARVEEGFTTRAEETAALTGGDFEQKHRQRVKEEKLRKEAGFREEKQQPPQGGSNEKVVSGTGKGE